MLSFLKNHPFAVETFFESSLVFTFAIHKSELQHLIPPCLQLDTLNDEWGFVAVAMVNTKKLRPKGFPAFLGNDFFLIGYRIFVKYTTSNGKRLRGLFILRSETNKKKMELLGSIFTKYKYFTTDIDYTTFGAIRKVLSKKSALDIEVNTGNKNAALPLGSPFKDWKEARRYAGPLPFTFSFNAPTSEVLMIEGVRENWIPKPVEVLKCSVGFIEKMNFKKIALANAFIIEQIPYHWNKGKKDLWKG